MSYSATPLPWRALFLLLLLLGCGDDSTDPNAGSDEPVEIEYLGEDTDYASVHFVFHRADGSIISATQLASDKDSATLSERVPRNGMLSIVRTYPGSSSLKIDTITGLQPGDDIVLGRLPRESGEVLGDLELTVDMPAGATNIQISGLCGFTSGVSFPWTREVRSDCVEDDSELSLLLVATAANEPVSYTYAVDHPRDVSGTTQLDLTASWRTDWQAFRLETPEIPLGVDQAFGYISGSHDGADVGSLGIEYWTPQSANKTSFEYELPRGLANQLFIQVNYSMGRDGRIYDEQIDFDESLSGHEITALPPHITNLRMDWSDPGQARLDWDADDDASDGDYYLLYFDWRTDGGSTRQNWEIHIDPNARSLRLPMLPEEFADRWPTQDSQPQAELELYVDSTINGYVDYRRNHVSGGGFGENSGPAVLMLSYTQLPEPEEEASR